MLNDDIELVLELLIMLRLLWFFKIMNTGGVIDIGMIDIFINVY